ILKQTGSKGVSYYDVLITNASDSNVTLHEINIDFSPLVVVSPNAEILAGGSDMGRTPIQRYLPTDKNIKSGMFLLVKNSDSDFLLIGILSWKVFLAKLMFGSNGMQIKTDADGKLLLPGDNVHFEKIVTIQGDNWQSLLDLYAKEIARENNISKTKDVYYKGWSTWDYYGRSFTQADIYANIEALAKLDTSANLIQIDGGWWTERGDYLTVRPDLTDGMKGIAKYISNHGYTPGIHLDGFRADLASNVAKQHPEYFLKDQNGDIIVTRNQKYDRVMNYIYFDYSHPDARNYIKNVLTIIKNEWGFKYFKIDFMRFGLKDDMLKVCPDVKEIQAHIPGMTHVERFRAGITAIKEALGDDVYFLGCSAVFGPAIGFVDGMRTGGDISPRFDFYKTRCLQNGGNYYLHKKVFNCDFDYLVFRNKLDEDEHVQTSTNKYGGDITLNEAKMWADYSTLFGSAKLASDNLQTLRDERKELIKHSFSFTGCDEFLPVDLWQHARDKEDAFSLFLGREGDNIYLVAFNWDVSATEMTITGFAHKNNQFLTGYPEQNKITIENGQFTLKMEEHSSHIFEYNGNDSYKSLKENLEIKLESHK
ncbi:MAG: alpha-galactosidase, partial [bacterium]